MKPRPARLLDIFEALDLMAERLGWSLRDDGHLFPVDSAVLRDRDTAKALDAFLKRFEQLCDHILRKLFPAIVAAAELEAVTRPFLDVLDRLHRSGVIDSPGTWISVIDLRNRLVHDYALDSAMLAEQLTAAWRVAPVLLAQIDTARRYVISHDMLNAKDIT